MQAISCDLRCSHDSFEDDPMKVSAPVSEISTQQAADPFGPPSVRTLPQLPVTAPVFADPAAQQRFVGSPRTQQPRTGSLLGFEAHRMMNDTELKAASASLVQTSTDASAKTPAAELLQAMHGTPSLDDALEYLVQLFTPGFSDAVRDAADQSALVAKATDVIAAHGNSGRAAFIERVLFNADSPASYTYLAPIALRLVPGDTLVREMAQHIERGTDLHVRNAASLAYFVSGRDRLVFTPEQRSALAFAKVMREGQAALNPLASEALREMRL
jgi:hypothetical protein